MADDIVEFRLNSIDKTLAELKDVMIKLTLVAQRVDDIDSDVKDLRGRVSRNSERLQNISNERNAGKAKWFDIVVNFIVMAALGYIAVKIGLK